ncbi:unannotated protein [freshwater metagenome]|uniref:Unannotated protein n=1 Tax=freshwater metagenome TaxID=449393 RepID=A0A6J6QT15_9ZZZZ
MTVDRQQRPPGQVAGQQLHGGQAAGVGQLGQGGGEGQPSRDADRRLEGRGHDDRQPDVLGDAQTGPHAAERLHLQHRDVGSLQLPHPVGVGRAADRLVGGDRHCDGTPHGRELLDRGARLLDVLQTAGRPVEHRDRAAGGVDVPEPVDVDAHPTPRTERVAHRLQPGLVVGEALAGLGDLDLRGAAAAVAHDRVRLLGSDGGHRDVDRDARAHRRRPVPQRRLLGAPQPGLGDLGVVLEEGAPLPPPGGTGQEHALAHGDPPEARAHRDRPDPHPRGAHARSRRARRSGLPLASRGTPASATSWRGAHDRGWVAATQSRASARSSSPTTNATSR